MPLSIPAHIRLIALLTCVFVFFVPRTTSPALLYSATCSHFLIGGRVVMGVPGGEAEEATRRQPTDSHTQHPWATQPYEWLDQPDQNGGAD
ncbi:hypothetical protein SSP531S_47560 [Streptomyces spongiicola]|uniref:Uncharacterized protein n=1 Tax=Streptomyces spongiicola TaxID=1690221 RepID=A0A388T430_9ACTN|nr:hypothetical protein SSP531S_47560 [Streptomyces spongiicola]